MVEAAATATTGAATAAAIGARGVTKHLAGRALLEDVSFEVPTGSFTVLRGRSGAGKSTLLAILGALDPDYQGEVRVLGEALPARERTRAAWRNQRLGFVFQIPRLFSGLSVWQNLTAPAWIGNPMGGAVADDARAAMLLDRVGLAEHAPRAVTGLSGGERQRLTLARALLNRPRVLLCDEPTGNLDADTGQELLALLDTLREREALSVLMVSHDPEAIARADQVLTLHAGRLSP